MSDEPTADAGLESLPVAEARAPARGWAVSLLEGRPWLEVASRATLLLASPPRVSWLTAAQVVALQPESWLLVDRADVRGLPPAQREPLAIHGVLVGDTTAGALVVLVAEAAELLIEGATRRSLEVRWTLAHAEPLHDPLRRMETLGRALGALPRGGEERVLRPLYLQVREALDSLATGSLPALGELAAAVSRLACVLDSGLHPPLEWLALEARSTALGGRLGGWLDDLVRASGGDADALRRVLASREGVARMLAEPIRELVGAADWLTAPRAYALRPPR